MAWTTPRTWTTGEVVTAAIMNTHVRDNLDDLDRRTTLSGNTIATAETTTSTAYADLTTSGPAVTVTVGANGRALVALYASAANTADTGAVFMSFAVSGATTIAAGDGFALAYSPPSAGTGMRASVVSLRSGLNSGSNTFTAKYRVVSGTGSWSDRKMIVIPQGS